MPTPSLPIRGLLVTASVMAAGLNPAAADPTVAVTAVVEHAELDAVRDGIRDGLAANGFVAGQTLTFLYESADADATRIAAIAERLAESSADVIVALSAPTARAVVGAVRDRPVVMSAVTDAMATRIIADAPGRNRNVAALVQAPPVRDQLGLVAQFAPDATVTLVPVPRPDRDGLAKRIERAAEDLALPIRLIRVGDGAAVADAVAEAAAPNAAVYLPDGAWDPLPVEAIAAVAAAAEMVVIGATLDAVAQGAVATVTHEPYAIGRQTGDAIAEILGGRAPRDIALRPATATFLVVNRPALEARATAGGLDAEAIAAGADLVYE